MRKMNRERLETSKIIFGMEICLVFEREDIRETLVLVVMFLVRRTYPAAPILQQLGFFSK